MSSIPGRQGSPGPAQSTQRPRARSASRTGVPRGERGDRREQPRGQRPPQAPPPTRLEKAPAPLPPSGRQPCPSKSSVRMGRERLTWRRPEARRSPALPSSPSGGNEAGPAPNACTTDRVRLRGRGRGRGAHLHPGALRPAPGGDTNGAAANARRPGMEPRPAGAGRRAHRWPRGRGHEQARAPSRRRPPARAPLPAPRVTALPRVKGSRRIKELPRGRKKLQCGQT